MSSQATVISGQSIQEQFMFIWRGLLIVYTLLRYARLSRALVFLSNTRYTRHIITELKEKSQRTWVLLIHQLAPKSTNLRVRIWRNLQKLGNGAIKNSGDVLPATSARL
jgi:hypothetical protein